MAKRKTHFSSRIPIVTIVGSETQMRPDLMVVIQDGHLRTSRLNPSAELTPLIRVVEILLDELKDKRWAAQQPKQSLKRKG